MSTSRLVPKTLRECKWCGHPKQMKPKQVFCSDLCRYSFHNAVNYIIDMPLPPLAESPSVAREPDHSPPCE